jgi:predicted transcriptional regulator
VKQQNTAKVRLKLSRVREILNAEVITGGEQLDEIEVDSCFSADLMSDVLARQRANGILLTGLKNHQVIRTAELADIRAVCIVRGKTPDADAVALSKQKEIPLLVTSLTMFEACGLLYVSGLRAVPAS